MEDGFDNLNRRIDDTNQRVDGCLTSINRRIDHLQSDIRGNTDDALRDAEGPEPRRLSGTSRGNPRQTLPRSTEPSPKIAGRNRLASSIG